MKKNNLLQTVLFVIAFMVMNQFSTAQTSCSGNKVRMSKGANSCCNGINCQTKCVDTSKVQHFLNHGWYYGTCHINLSCCCCGRLSGTELNAANSEYDISIHPNPISNSTTISFSLPQSQNVSIKIFNLNGRLITTLTDKIFEAGENELLWNVEDVNAGIYFLQFQSEETLQTEKLIVTK